MYKYFVSFKCNAGDGNGIITVTKKINDNESLRTVERLIAEEKDQKMVTINNFILLEEKA